MIVDVVWKGDNDDASASVGEYFLRAEQMDQKKFWWCVYFKDKQIDSCWGSGGLTNSMESAKTRATKAMKKHYYS